MKYKTLILTALLLAVLASGCASIFSKSNYPLQIETDPSGAKVVVKDWSGREIFKGTSPTSVTLKASSGFFEKARYSVIVQKEGYEERIMPVDFKIDGWYFGNLFIGGFLGMLIIDPATGAMFKIDQDYMHLTLEPEGSAQLRIIDLNSVPEHLREYLEPAMVGY